ncbi:hypothetical protein D9M69_475070 [compost metagenome]
MSAWIRLITPPMMVAGDPLPKKLTVIIGSRLAGMNRIVAVISNAQLRAMLFGRRACSFASQRRHCCCDCSSVMRLSWWHSAQTRMPASIARIVILFDRRRGKSVRREGIVAELQRHASTSLSEMSADLSLLKAPRQPLLWVTGRPVKCSGSKGTCFLVGVSSRHAETWLDHLAPTYE